MANTKNRLIPAVAYMRKSTAGQGGDGRERQEKSIGQQRREIVALADGKYKIIRWYTDEGVSGWKRDTKRPDFNRMLNDAKDQRDVQAVLCDDLDRFSRAEVMEVFSDLSTLASAGVKTIHCRNQGEYGLGDNDIGRIIKMVVDVHGGNDYSRKLSRRICLARRNAALDAKRSGGAAPYGLTNDGNGGLELGDAHAIKIVRWIFDQFVHHARSLNSIVAELNKGTTASPKGGLWYRATVAALVRQRAYRGDFEFNRTSEGRFFRIDDGGDVVGADGNTRGKLFAKQGVYQSIIDPRLWDQASERLETVSKDRSRRKRVGYALTGILVCDHCGRPLFGSRPAKGKPQYRCPTNSDQGPGSCGYFHVNEEDILPFVLRVLGEEIADLTRLIAVPPNELLNPCAALHERRIELEQKAKALTVKIGKAEDNLLFVDDSRTRKSLDAKVTAMRDELDSLNLELKLAQTEGSESASHTQDHIQQLNDWWKAFCQAAVLLPLDKSKHKAADYHIDLGPNDVEAVLNDDFAPLERGTWGKMCDPRMVNEALQSLGTEVRLRWRKDSVTTANGKPRNRYTLVRGRFRLGQTSGNVPQQVLYGTGCRLAMADVRVRLPLGALISGRGKVWQSACFGRTRPLVQIQPS